MNIYMSIAFEHVYFLHLHAQIRRRLFKAKILNDIRMVEVLQGFTLDFEGLHNRNLTRIVLITRSSGHLDLFNSNHLASGGV